MKHEVFHIRESWYDSLLSLQIKDLRERDPPHVLTDVDPAVIHWVLADRVRITELIIRPNTRQIPLDNRPLFQPCLQPHRTTPSAKSKGNEHMHIEKRGANLTIIPSIIA